MVESYLKPVALSIGDPAGIALDILKKSLSHLNDCHLFAPAYLRDSLEEFVEAYTETYGESPCISASKESGEQAYDSFKKAALAVKNGSCRALCTLPLAKDTVAQSVPHFTGHTDELAKFWEGTSLMTLMGGHLKVALVTDHMPIKKLSQYITVENILEKARVFRSEVTRYFTRDREPILHMLGLNPHAGESGVLGDEEKVVQEALEILKSEGGQWQGPWPADSFFAKGEYGDGVLAMYHDQGLIPVKMLSKLQGVHLTLGLPYLRTSPDHGTAFDIAGKGVADPTSFQKALQMAKELSLGAKAFVAD